MPDIHWRIGEGNEQETIAETSSPRRLRRSWIAVLVVTILGASLGVVYRSIPEPAPRPTSMPSPTPLPIVTHPAMPAKLYATIDREAQALADGDLESYLALKQSLGVLRINGQKRDVLPAWGRPADDQPLYTIIDFKLRTPNKAWVDIRQFRNGRWFRETRFYLLYEAEDRWRKIDHDTYFWGGQVATFDTPHFHVIYAVEDRELIPAAVSQLEEDYASLCRDLDCAAAGHEMTFTVQRDEYTSDSYFALSNGSELWFPSPRFMGLFENGRAYDWSNSNVHMTLASLMVRRVAYGNVDLERPGQIILDAAAIWAIDHIDSLPEDFRRMLGAVNQRALLPIDELWGKPEPSTIEQAYAQAYMLMRFIEQEYGAPAIARLLEAIGTAQSFSEAIEQGFGIPFDEFEVKWQIWTKKFLTPLT